MSRNSLRHIYTPPLELPSFPGLLPQPQRSLKVGRLVRHYLHSVAHAISELENGRTPFNRPPSVLLRDASEPPKPHRNYLVYFFSVSPPVPSPSERVSAAIASVLLLVALIGCAHGPLFLSSFLYRCILHSESQRSLQLYFDAFLISIIANSRLQSVRWPTPAGSVERGGTRLLR